MLWAAARALARMGARVEVDTEGENLVRSLSPADGTTSADDGASAPCALVQAQGLPNLLHELVHAVQADRLDDDHGIDYGAIPFDLDTVPGRAVLWDELSCCVISCAYLWRQGRAARRHEPESSVAAEVDDWFVEQVEIQPVFYGLEDDPPAFHVRVADLLREHETEADAVLSRAYALTERALVDAGSSTELSVPGRRLTFATLWPRAAEHRAAAE